MDKSMILMGGKNPVVSVLLFWIWFLAKSISKV